MNKIIILAVLLSLAAQSYAGTEAHFNALFCDKAGGEQETRHEYTYGEGQEGKSHVFVDCETSTTVWEGGLDKRSSLDSIQQALFFSYLTGKNPGVVIYDTDGKEGRFEYRIRIACQKAGVIYRRALLP